MFLDKVRRFIAEQGLWRFLVFTIQRTVRTLSPGALEAVARWQIRKWLTRQLSERRVYVLWSTLDWGYPFWQRPHHLARALAALGHPVIYVTPGARQDLVMLARAAQEGILLTPSADAALAVAPRPALVLLSTDTRWQPTHLERVRAAGGVVVYDYLDALDDTLSVSAITAERRALHERLLADESGTVVVSVADILAQEVATKRKKHHGVVTNGVDLAPFLSAVRDHTLRSDFATVVNHKRPIIGYFGSLAAWVDYGLLLALAEARPEFEVVLIGPKLDGSSGALAQRPANLHVLPAIAYSELPRYGAWFDVCIVPFVINDITLATSPLKIFEYMAMAAPIVSTALPECRKYASILIGEDPVDFIRKVDLALDSRDDPALRRLRLDEAKTNDWAIKAIEIEEMVAALVRRGLGHAT
jgi:teichuronic acid biosynthesis glycosyltransferase TuaH